MSRPGIKERNMKILMALTSHDVLGKTGFWLLKSSQLLTLFSGTLVYS
jgi:hypothetical protein